MKDFWYYYLRSMRLYYCFVTGVSTLAGCAYMHHTRQLPWDRRDAAVLLIGFLAWGVNQIVSDWFDRKEDALNAPHRPMVTGKLPPRPALLLSSFMMLLFAATAYLISPWSLAVLLAGGALNVLYSLLKGVPVIGTVVYGLALCCCTLFGISAHPGVAGIAASVLACLCWILPSHVLMCHNSYFKDVVGDRAAGLRTLPVLFPAFSRHLGLALSAVWSLLLAAFQVTTMRTDFEPLHALPIAGCVILMFYLTARLFAALRQREYLTATKLNCQLCVLWLWCAPGFFVPPQPLGAILCVLLIQLVYRWYPDEKE